MIGFLLWLPALLRAQLIVQPTCTPNTQVLVPAPCQACDPSCLTCVNSGPGNCLTCPSGTNQISSPVQQPSPPAENVPVAPGSFGFCPCIDTYTWVTNVCVKCNDPCVHCFNTPYYCITCNYSGGYQIDAISGACHCNIGGGTGVCTSLCHHSCMSCTAVPTQTQPKCTACDTTKKRLDLSASCNTCPCIDGYYDDGVNAACQLCPSNCLTCELNPVAGGSPPVICTMCPNPMTTQNYTSPASPTCECLVGYAINAETNLCSPAPLVNVASNTTNTSKSTKSTDSTIVTSCSLFLFGAYIIIDWVF